MIEASEQLEVVFAVADTEEEAEVVQNSLNVEYDKPVIWKRRRGDIWQIGCTMCYLDPPPLDLGHILAVLSAKAVGLEDAARRSGESRAP